MKIIFIFLIGFFFISPIFAEEFEEDCEFYKKEINNTVVRGEASKFNELYAYNFCEKSKEIHKDIFEELKKIKDEKEKTIQQLITDAGNTYCRDYFGACSEDNRKDTFYHRFRQACIEARDQTLEDAKNDKIPTIVVNEQLTSSMREDCNDRVRTFMVAYKLTAIEEIARNHMERIERSNYEYFSPAYFKMKSLSIVWNTFLKIFGNISRSLEGLTPEVFLSDRLK